jgi:hypothetical protein
MATPASNIITFLCIFAFTKLSLALNSSESLGSSHFNLTNHHRGIRLSVYLVHDLSFHSVNIFGGIHIPNSNTLTHDFFAAKK